MDKRFWGVLALIVLVLGSVFFITNNKKAAAPGSQSGTLTNHVENGGPNTPKLTEYGDFECPACGSYYPLVKQVTELYKNRLTFQFRNFPLFQMHKNAIAAARAAEAADMQGKYWEMSDKLYTENGYYYKAQQQSKSYPTWISSTNPIDEFAGYASTLGLDVAKFKQDYASSAVNDRIQADLKEGNRLKVDSTPTFFIDGKKISNPTSLDGFKKVIDAAIAQKAGNTSGTSANRETTTTPTPAPTTAP